MGIICGLDINCKYCLHYRKDEEENQMACFAAKDIPALQNSSVELTDKIESKWRKEKLTEKNNFV